MKSKGQILFEEMEKEMVDSLSGEITLEKLRKCWLWTNKIKTLDDEKTAIIAAHAFRLDLKFVPDEEKEKSRKFLEEIGWWNKRNKQTL